MDLLLLIGLFPLFTIGVLLLLPSKNTRLIKVTGLAGAWITFILSTLLWIGFDKSTAEFQFVTEHSFLLPFTNTVFSMGIDGISLFFILLTTLLIPICLLAGWDTMKEYTTEYVSLFLLLESLLIFAFTVLDLLYFYVFFEAILIPMFIIIGVWGSRERKIHAAYYLTFYTIGGSVMFLLAILVIYFQTGTTDLEVLLTTTLGPERQLLLWLAFFTSFSVKVPSIPFHIWLPEAHVEAPTAGSVILAGVLLKLGGYGFLRFSLPILPYATAYFTPLIMTISVIGVIYAALTTLRQVDLKKIIAYSSVSHMAFVTLGIFTLNLQGVEGSILLMLSHGLVSGALFFSVGLVYERHHTRLLEYYGGIVNVMPVYSILLLFFTLGNISFPMTSSFVGEFLVIIGAFQVNTSLIVMAGTGIVLGAAYSIWLYNRVAFGPFKTAYISQFVDVNKREFFVLALLAVLVLIMGIYPELFLDPLHTTVGSLLEDFTPIR